MLFSFRVLHDQNGMHFYPIRLAHEAGSVLLGLVFIQFMIKISADATGMRLVYEFVCVRAYVCGMQSVCARVLCFVGLFLAVM